MPLHTHLLLAFNIALSTWKDFRTCKVDMIVISFAIWRRKLKKKKHKMEYFRCLWVKQLNYEIRWCARKMKILVISMASNSPSKKPSTIHMLQIIPLSLNCEERHLSYIIYLHFSFTYQIFRIPSSNLERLPIIILIFIAWLPLWLPRYSYVKIENVWNVVFHCHYFYLFTFVRFS